MKHIIKATSGALLALCTIGISLTACSSNNDFDEESAESTEVKVNISSRASEAGTSWWKSGDIVTLQAYASGSEAPNQTANYTLDATNKWTTATSMHWASYKTPLDFMGYYPSTATSNGLAFAIPADQSDAAKLHNADYMTTDRLYSVTNTTDKGTQVDFAFSHRLVKVVLNLSYATEFDGSIPTLSDANIFSQGSGVTVTTNADNSTTTVATTGDAMTVSPLATLNGSNAITAYTALVAPCTISGGSFILMSMSVNNKTLWAAYTSSLTALESGKAYNFNLKVGKDNVEVTGITITQWGDNTTATGNTTIEIPDAGTTDVAGIFVNYNNTDITNADNIKLSAASNWMIDHTWYSQTATPHIIIYSPYVDGTTYDGMLTLANGNDYHYVSINDDHSKMVSELLTNGKLTVAQDDYQHKMCKLSIAFTDASGNAITPTAVTLKDIYTAGTLTINTGVVATTGDKSSVSLTATNGKCPDYYIVPQTIAAGSWLITATIDGKPYEYYADSTTGLKLTEGDHVTLKLSLPTATRALQSATATERMNASITINNSWK